MIKERDFLAMKKTSYFINTARAELVEKGALYKALKNKWIAGAAIDVLWDEKPDGSHLKADPLWQYAKTNSNLLISPHIGGAAYEAMYATQEFIADLTVKYFRKEK
jgi:phosphoglycerate dehydrogenase-like enzyme